MGLGTPEIILMIITSIFVLVPLSIVFLLYKIYKQKAEDARNLVPVRVKANRRF